VLLLVLFAAIVVTVKRGWSSPLAAGAVAGLVALAVHSGFDFLWHIPVLPLLGGLLIGLTAARRSEEAQPEQQHAQPPEQPEQQPEETPEQPEQQHAEPTQPPVHVPILKGAP